MTRKKAHRPQPAEDEYCRARCLGLEDARRRAAEQECLAQVRMEFAAWVKGPKGGNAGPCFVAAANAEYEIWRLLDQNGVPQDVISQILKRTWAMMQTIGNLEINLARNKSSRNE